MSQAVKWPPNTANLREVTAGITKVTCPVMLLLPVSVYIVRSLRTLFSEIHYSLGLENFVAIKNNCTQITYIRVYHTPVNDPFSGHKVSDTVIGAQIFREEALSGKNQKVPVRAVWGDVVWHCQRISTEVGGVSEFWCGLAFSSMALTRLRKTRVTVHWNLCFCVFLELPFPELGLNPAHTRSICFSSDKVGREMKPHHIY